MNRKRIKEGPDPNQTRFKIGEYVTVAPDSPLARGIALIAEAARQRTERIISQNPDPKRGASN